MAVQLRGQQAPPLVELRAGNIARPRKVNLVPVVDPAAARGHHDDAVSQKDRFLSDGNALLHAAGELVRIDIGKILQADEFDEMIRCLADFGFGAPLDFGPKPTLSRTLSHGNSP
jgi:hypothetical protein